MPKKAIIQTNFSAGWATDLKVGPENSFAYSHAADFRKSPSQITPLPRAVREDNGVVKDLVQAATIDKGGDIFYIGSDGFFYRRKPNAEWSTIGNLSPGAFGILYRQDQDAIYIAHQKTVSLYNSVSTTPVLNPDFYNDSHSTYNNSAVTGFNVSAFQTDGAETTSIGTSFNESDPKQKRFFQTDIEPLNKIQLFIVEKGAGDWTLTLHDGLNTVLGSVTILNADVKANDWNDFEFASQVRVNVAPAAQTYHLHVTSTATGGTVRSTALNDLSTCDLQVWADRLVDSQNGMHPTVGFQQFVCIGNERYLSVWEPLGTPEPSNSEWLRHKLTFPPGYEVCGLAVFNEYLAIATERVSVEGSPQNGIIFFWDGLSTTYNYFMRVPEGSPYALHEHDNALYYEAGGAWYVVPSVQSTPIKIRTLPFGENAMGNNNDKTIVYPYAATVRNGVQLMAWPSTTQNESIEFGVYAWGRVDKNQPFSFGYSYPISTGTGHWTPSNNLTIGMVQNYGDNLFISWRDGDNYGVDVVNSSCPPAPYSTLEMLIYDNGYPGKLKEVEYIEATWLPLPVGVRVALKYGIDRGAWVYSEEYTTTNQWEENPDYARYNSFSETERGGRFRELQVGIDIYCEETVTEMPVITSLSAVVDSLSEEALQ